RASESSLDPGGQARDVSRFLHGILRNTTCMDALFAGRRAAGRISEVGTSSKSSCSCAGESECAKGSRSFRANDLCKLPRHQGHNCSLALRPAPALFQKPQTTRRGNRRQHAGKLAPLAARSAAGQDRGQDAELQIYRGTGDPTCPLHRDVEMNGNATITATVARLLTPEERQHWKLAWLSTVDHKRIGVLYMLTGLVFFVIAGIEALLIRFQLRVPNNTLLAPDTYNWMFTMHGTTMIFLVAMPVLFGIMNYILPLQIGARDMAFPRLNALGVWLVPFGGILLHFSFLAGG